MSDRFDEYLEIYNRNLPEKKRLVLEDCQKDIIKTKCNMVCSANAGSGKTTLLALRYLYLILSSDGKVQPQNILTLTFTKKAAAEMKERIGYHIAMAYSNGMISNELYSNFQKASISTIDSFFSEVVKIGSNTAGVPRDFRQEEKIDINNLLTATLNDPEASRLLKTIKDFSSADENDIITVLSGKARLEEQFDAHDVVLRFREILSACHIDTFEKAEAEMRKLLPLHKNEEEAARILNMLDNLEAPDLLPKDLSLKLNGKINDAALDKTLKEIAGKDPIIKKDQEEAACRYYKFLRTAMHYCKYEKEYDNAADAANSYVEFIKNWKKKAGLLTFADTANAALRILKENKEIRSYYKKRFSFIMIDEFQDNNNLQKEALYLLAEKNGLESDSVPRPEDLDPEKLFFVGDDKQSIYRFRGADVSVFNNLKNELGAEAEKTIPYNYRSTAGLIGYINNVFSNKIFDNKSASGRAIPYKADFSRLLRHPSNKDEYGRSRIEFAYFNNGVRDAKDSGLKAQARYIADKIIEFTKEGEFSFKDIMILSKSSTKYKTLENELRKRNIPYMIDNPGGLENSAVTRDLISLISTMLYSDDYVSRAALLISPFIGIPVSKVDAMLDSDVLKHIYDEDTPENVLVQAGLDSRDIDSLRSFASKLAIWRKDKENLTLPSLLNKIWKESGYEKYLEDNGLEDYKLHYDFLFAHARLMEKQGKKLASYLSALKDKDTFKNMNIDIYPKTQDAVSIMTIHKSKGLEAEVVFLFNISQQNPPDSTDAQNRHFLFYGNSALPIPYKPGKLLDATDDEMEKKQEEAEADRLLYVALTRAKSHLMITADISFSSNNNISHISQKPLLNRLVKADGISVKSHKLCLDGNGENRLSIVQINNNQSDHEKIRKNPASCCHPSFAAPIRVRAVTSLEEMASSNENRQDAKALSIEDELIQRHPAEFGTLVHGMLEAALNGKDASLVQCDISESQEENLKIQKYASSLVSGFLASNFKKELFKDATGFRTEYGFFSYIGNQNYDVLEGVIDLVVLKKDEAVIVDYKTDSRIMPETHQIQLKLYSKIAKGLFNKDKVRAFLYYLRFQKEVEIEAERLPDA